MNNSHCRLRKRPSLAGVGVAAALLAAGCDARDVTAPAPSATPQDGPRLNTEGGALGSMLLRPPPTSHPNDVAAPPFQPFSPAPAGSWIIIRTSGQVHSDVNEACGKAATELWPCQTGNQLSPFSPTFPSTVGPVQVVLQTGTSETPVPLRGAGGGGIGLLYSSNGGVLAGRVMLAANFWWAAGHDHIPAFTFSGGYSVTAEAVPPPLEVVESGGGAGAPKVYSVAPLYGLQLINPRDPYYFQFWPAGAVTWTFVRGENVSDDPRVPGIEHIPVNDCGFQITCSYTPPGPGRMQATAWVEGRPVTIRSAVAAVTPPSLDLSCPATILRGANMRCTVVATGGTLSKVQWLFVDTLHHRIPGPADSLSWRGQMVIGGRMYAEGEVNGVAVRDSADVAVRARTWNNIRLNVRQDSYPAGHLPAPSLVTLPGHLGDSHADSVAPLHTKQIADGPNAGWWFLEREVRDFGFVVHINEAAFSSGSAWHSLQTGGNYTPPGGGPTVPNGRCNASQIPIIRQLTREHEGLASSPLTSHADAARRYLANTRPQVRFEAAIAYGPDLSTGYSYYTHVHGLYIEIASSMEGFAAPHTIDSPPGIVNPAPFPCYLRPWW